MRYLLDSPVFARSAELISGLDATAISAYAALLTAGSSFLVGAGKLISILRTRSRNRPIEDAELAWLREEIHRAHEHHDDPDDEDA